MKPVVENINVKLRIGVHPEECLLMVDMTLDGHALTLSMDTTKALTEKLLYVAATAERFAIEEAARAALAGR